jgi:hypothetical protein
LVRGAVLGSFNIFDDEISSSATTFVVGMRESRLIFLKTGHPVIFRRDYFIFITQLIT